MMKIKKINRSHRLLPTARQTPTQASTSTDLETPVEPQISMDSEWLQQAQQTLAQMPNIDKEKIARLKAALNKGDFKLNISELSKAIISFHTGHQ